MAYANTTYDTLYDTYAVCGETQPNQVIMNGITSVAANEATPGIYQDSFGILRGIKRPTNLK